PDPVNVLAFTDGLVERRTESLDVGLERLRMAVSTSDLPIDRLVTSVVESLAVDGSSDDIAVLGLRWSSPMPPSDPPPEHDRAAASSRVSAS
ncbi:MAG: SpoIIE family protein phosphatase, partial [Acidimicrobiia bacterium]